jgi:nitrate reductase alpha subunit
MAAARGRAGVGSELDEALVRAGRYLRKGVVSADLRTLQKSGGREADSFYRDRWSYDKVVRSTHGVNCTGSCSWKVYVKDGIITWEAQQTDYPSPGRTGPTTSRGGARAARRSPGTPTRRPGPAIPPCAACCLSCSDLRVASPQVFGDQTEPHHLLRT